VEHDNEQKFDITDMKFNIGPADKVFGPGGVRLKMQGSAELMFGFKHQYVDNPALTERSRNNNIFDFDEKIQVNVNGKVGDKLNFNMGYNTEASFSFDQINLNIKDYYSLDHDLTAMAVMRNYIPLGSSRRFALFNETQLSYGIGQAKLIDNHGASLVGTYEKSQTVSLGLNPGMMAFINNHLAIEVNVGMLGLKYSHTDQIHNQVDTGNLKATQINFKVNILAIGFGISYYL
jgi:putative salt-induced outer membrane protein YdiY